MDQQTFLEIATIVSKLKMYPYFDVASYILMCLIVRDDNPPQTSGKIFIKTLDLNFQSVDKSDVMAATL